MLIELTVEDFAIIGHVSVQFRPGFTAVTGETGAGKSLLVDAISIVLGERASADMVRSGAVRAVVSVVFEPPATPQLRYTLDECGAELEDGRLFVSREITAAGKSLCRLNGRPLPVAALKRIGDLLVDLHGQHEHQSLLRSERHVDFLDSWLGEQAMALRERIRAGVTRYSELNRRIEELKAQARDRERLLDLYRYQANEIAAATLRPNEDADLMAEQLRLASAEKLFETTAAAHEALASSDGPVTDSLRRVVALVQEAVALDASLAPTLEMLQTALFSAEDAAAALQAYRDSIEFGPEKLDEIGDRLDLIKRLKRKYGDTIEEVLAFGEDVQQKLVDLNASEEQVQSFELELSEIGRALDADAQQLTSLRREGGVRFVEQVQSELRPLAMEHAVFEVSILPKPVDSTGADHVEFHFSANLGEPPRPLARIASGGEVSRVMLAVKTVLADRAGVPTLIFDEVDAGLGGHAAVVVGAKLAGLSAHAQVLSITHLPQIASRAHAHIRLQKQVADGHTQVTAEPLTGDERTREIARMISGEPTDVALRHAREMLQAPEPSATP